MVLTTGTILTSVVGIQSSSVYSSHVDTSTSRHSSSNFFSQVFSSLVVHSAL